MKVLNPILTESGQIKKGRIIPTLFNINSSNYSLILDFLPINVSYTTGAALNTDE